MSTLRVNTIQDATGGSNISVPGTAKAWVNFNGTGTVAIRAALNVSSITDNGTGDYTVNFTTPIDDANYSIGGMVDALNSTSSTIPIIGIKYLASLSTGAAPIETRRGTTREDPATVCVSIFR